MNDVNRVCAGPGGLAVFGEGLVLVVEIAGSNSASDIDVCPMSQDEALRRAEHYFESCNVRVGG